MPRHAARPALRKLQQARLRADGLIAADLHWHRNCLRCAHGSCGTLLGERLRHGAHPTAVCTTSRLRARSAERVA